MKRDRATQHKIIQSILDCIGKGLYVKMSHIICKKYGICERQYYRYLKLVYKIIGEKSKAEYYKKLENAELFYEYKLIELKNSAMPDAQKQTLILKTRLQLDKIQGLITDKIDHTTKGEKITEFSIIGIDTDTPKNTNGT